MFKAMLIVYALNGSVISQVGYSSMHECMSNRESIQSQSANINVLCLPSNSDYQMQQIDVVFNKFKSMVRELNDTK